MTLREELAEIFIENHINIALSYDIADIILSPEMLKLLLPLYEIDTQEAREHFFHHLKDRILFSHYCLAYKDPLMKRLTKALSRPNIIKVKESLND